MINSESPKITNIICLKESQIVPNRENVHSSDDEESDMNPHHQSSSILGVSINMCNTIVGAGIVSLPSAFMNSGIIAGSVLLIFVSYLVQRSLMILTEVTSFHPVGKKFKVKSFEQLLFLCFGTLGRWFGCYSLFVTSFGPMIAYLIILKDTIPPLIQLDHGVQPQIILIILSSSIILPISMQKDISSLEKTSILGMTGSILTIILIAIIAPIPSSMEDNGGIGEVIVKNAIKANIFFGLGIMTSAMTCQQSAFFLFDSLKNKTPHRWWLVTFCGLFVCTCLTITVGITGYLGYMDDTEGDILKNFPEDTLADVGRAVMGGTMLFTYPMESYVARYILCEVLYEGNVDDIAVESTNNQNFCTRFTLNRRKKVTLYLFIAALVPALFCSSLDSVLSIVGSIGGSSLTYISPGLAYIGMNGKAFLEWAYGLLGYDVSYNGTSQRIVEYDELNKECQEIGSNTNTVVTSTMTYTSESLVLTEPLLNSSILNESNIGPKSCFQKLWWYFFLFPIWCSLARKSNERINAALADLEPTIEDDQPTSTSNFSSRPKPKFAFALFLIFFGVSSIVTGVIINIIIICQNMNWI